MKRKTIMLLEVLIVAFLVIYVPLALYVASYTTASTKAKKDAAIVLGARAYLHGSYNPCLVSRVQTAAKLYKNGQVKTVIMSGGNDVEDHVNEAKTMRTLAKQYGVPEKAVLLEPTSTSTYENIQHVQKLMPQKNIDSVIIVTEPFHIARARLVANSVGIDADYVAAAHSPCWEKWRFVSRYFLQEPIAIIYYILRGRITPQAFLK